MTLLRIVLPLGLLSVLSVTAWAEQLPFKTYTTADGLARDQINRIIRDSRGLLWFCTPEGLSLFDGYQFTNYTTDTGLPHRHVSDLLEARDGTYWVATYGGLARFNPRGAPRGQSRVADSASGVRTENRLSAQPPIRNPRSAIRDPEAPMFTVYRPGDGNSLPILSLLEDREGRIWCGTVRGLYRVLPGGDDVSFEAVRTNTAADAGDVYRMIEDRRGALWLGTNDGLYERLPDNRTKHFPTGENAGGDRRVYSLLEDREGQVWAAGGGGLHLFIHSSGAGHAALARVYTTGDGLTSDSWLNALFQTSDGRLWVGGLGALHEMTWDEGLRRHAFSVRMRDVVVTALAEDGGGNLWVGAETGATKLVRSGFSRFTEADGLESVHVQSIFADARGDVCVMTTETPAELAASAGRGPTVNCFDGRRFAAARPRFPSRIKNWGWGTKQVTFQDHTGGWWYATGEGLYRFPATSSLAELARARPAAVYTMKDGLPHSEVFRLYEDSRGDVWISAIGVPYESPDTLVRWERATDKYVTYDHARVGLPIRNAPSAFGEDARGNLWIGFYRGELARLRDGVFTIFTARDGLPADFITSIYRDRAGRLWVATRSGGLTLVEGEASERPRFRTYTTADGLSSNEVTCITEDESGRVYVGTGRGVNRLDPGSGRVKHYTTADGLASNYVHTALRDRTGALWFGTVGGLSRLRPEPHETTPPPVLISGLRISGIPQQLSALGETSVRGLVLAPDERQLQIDFFAPGFAAGETLRYQYKIEGLKQDWSQPSNQRAVDINLSPGTYRFLVRAVNTEGTISPAPAVVAFTILPPVWQRWWFLALAALVVGAVVVSVERYRAARMRELNVALGRSEKLTEVLTAQRAELRKANRSLELEYAATSVLADHTTLAAIRPRLLQAICEHTDWEIGALWEVDTQAQVLRCLDTWHQPRAGAPLFEERCREFVRAPGEGLPGRVWESGEPYWVTDLAAEADSPRIKFAVEEGLKSAYGVPILLEAEVIGVLEFFSREARQPDDEQLKMLSAIGNHVGQLIERKRAEEELRRSREERLRELERVRTRIATDLHDDIGSSLTQIVILSEVAHQQAARHDGAAAGPLSLISGISNELVEAMSDIVWAINPRKDHLSDLAFRMRRFASDLFTARGIKFHFHAPDLERDVRLGANVRREVFLIFKESVNNVVKHAACTEVNAEFHIADGRLTLRLRDDGRGFDPAPVAGGGNGTDAAAGRGGNGLPSMRKRAEELGGTFEVATGAGRGTAVVLSVPVEHQASGAEEVATRVGGDARPVAR